MRSWLISRALHGHSQSRDSLPSHSLHVSSIVSAVNRSTLFRDFVPVLTQIMFWALLIGAALVFRATVCIYIVASEQEQVDCYNSSKCQSSEALHLMVPYYIGLELASGYPYVWRLVPSLCGFGSVPTQTILSILTLLYLFLSMAFRVPLTVGECLPIGLALLCKMITACMCCRPRTIASKSGGGALDRKLLASDQSNVDGGSGSGGASALDLEAALPVCPAPIHACLSCAVACPALDALCARACWRAATQTCPSCCADARGAPYCVAVGGDGDGGSADKSIGMYGSSGDSAAANSASSSLRCLLTLAPLRPLLEGCCCCCGLCSCGPDAESAAENVALSASMLSGPGSGQGGNSAAGNYSAVSASSLSSSSSSSPPRTPVPTLPRIGSANYSAFSTATLSPASSSNSSSPSQRRRRTSSSRRGASSGHSFSLAADGPLRKVSAASAALGQLSPLPPLLPPSAAARAANNEGDKALVCDERPQSFDPNRSMLAPASAASSIASFAAEQLAAAVFSGACRNDGSGGDGAGGSSEDYSDDDEYLDEDENEDGDNDDYEDESEAGGGADDSAQDSLVCAMPVRAAHGKSQGKGRGAQRNSGDSLRRGRGGEAQTGGRSRRGTRAELSGSSAAGGGGETTGPGMLNSSIRQFLPQVCVDQSIARWHRLYAALLSIRMILSSTQKSKAHCPL